MQRTKKKSNEEEVIELLRQITALLYHQTGLGQPDIAKRIGISTGKLNSYLKDLDKKKKWIYENKGK